MISARLGTLIDTETVLSIEDAYLLLEIQAIDSHNRWVASKPED